MGIDGRRVIPKVELGTDFELRAGDHCSEPQAPAVEDAGTGFVDLFHFGLFGKL